MLRAAEYWLLLASEGHPPRTTKHSIGDVILAAQVSIFRRDEDRVVVATSNPLHLRLFASAEQWQDIQPFG